MGKIKYHLSRTFSPRWASFIMHLFVVCLFITSGCQSIKTIKKQSIATARKEFIMAKEDILKDIKKPKADNLYSNPTIFDYYNLAIWNNKDIDIEISRLLKIYSSIKSIYFEDPQFGINFAPIYGILKSGGPFAREFMLSQVFPAAGKLSLEKKSLYTEFKSQYYNTLNTMLEIQKGITINLILWGKLRIIKNIKGKKIFLLKKIKKYLITAIKFSKDNVTFQNIIQINLDISRLKKEIWEIDSKISNIKNILATYLYVRDYQKLKLPDLRAIIKLGNRYVPEVFSHSPILRKYKEIIKKSKIEIDRATRNFVPDIGFTLGFTFKSMDAVNGLMGKKGFLSSLMMNLPVYQEKLKAILLSSVYENLATKYEYDSVERTLLKNYINNEIEKSVYEVIVSIIKKELKEVRKLNSYINLLNKLGHSDYIQNLQISIMKLDYKEALVDISYERSIRRLENRFLVGKFILGGNK